MAGPFPARVVHAVGACTRALAGARDADAALPEAHAATLGALRAHADRLAIRRRHDDPSIDAVHRPADASAAEIFDALMRARLDALGARWLTGIARNLLAHPGAEDDGVRWLAFEPLSGLAAPPEKTALVARVRAAIAASQLERLAGLAAYLDDQPAFAERAAAWAIDVAGRLPRAPADAARRRLTLPTPTGVDIRRGRYARPGARPPAARDGEAQRDDLSTTAPSHDAAPPAGSDYHAYTTAHDRVVNAASLATRAELARLRATMEAELGAMRSTAARLAKQLLRVLMARQAREWRFDLDDGLLDASRLAALVASRGHARPFKQEFDSTFPSTVVTLLIDHSGSMRGRPMQIAALTVEVFARVLERCGVRCEVLGFTTRDWDGGEPAQQWARDGYPDNPGRLNALEHIVIKPADVPWRRARVALGLFLRDEMLKENIDGEALAWAHARLLARTERRRILVVVSDGTPMDEATFAANGFDYLDGHLVDVIGRIEARSPVQLAAIGIGHDVSRFYRNATRIARVDDLGPALGAKLTALLRT